MRVKNYFIISIVFVLVAALLAGCGGTKVASGEPDESDAVAFDSSKRSPL